MKSDSLSSNSIFFNFDLSSLNTLHLNSYAEYFVEIENIEQLKVLTKNLKFRNMPWKILGGGSNLVLPPKINGLVLKINNKGLKLVSEDNNFWYINSSAGEIWNDLIQWTLMYGYFGLENLSLIPGTVGAAPIQNIGAYGVEVKDFIWEVNCIDLKTGVEKKFTNSECLFAYRDSIFKKMSHSHYLVWDVTFRIPKNNILHLEYGDIRAELKKLSLKEDFPPHIAQAIVNIRQKKLPDPRIIGNAGSFFKNPIVSKVVHNDLLKKYPNLVSYEVSVKSVKSDKSHISDKEDNSECKVNSYKLAAGWLIDQSGWKGKKLGLVGMFEKQALVLVNYGGSITTSNEVQKLATEIINDVKNKFGVQLEPEPIFW